MEELTEDDIEKLIRNRKIVTIGKNDLPAYKIGNKMTFHFKTEAIFEDKSDLVLVDDSRSYKKPMEMFIGKKFKLLLWEYWVKEMRLEEISQIELEWKYCLDVYPKISKHYRCFALGKHSKSHGCGCMATSTGFPDLDKLIQNPPNRLLFTIELILVEQIYGTDNEIWLMNEKEMNENYPELKRLGNELFAEKRYEEASIKYCKALDIIVQLMAKEKPGTKEWSDYDLKKIPLLSNLLQCNLYMEDYYSAIRHADQVLERSPNHVKALYRRAKAHAAVWNVDESKKDYQRVLELDPSLNSIVKQELDNLNRLVKQKEHEYMNIYKGKLF